jgi:hypothetical protein
MYGSGRINIIWVRYEKVQLQNGERGSRWERAEGREAAAAGGEPSLDPTSLARRTFTRLIILAAHDTAPKQLPHIINAVNQPYSRHTRCRPSSSIRHHRRNIDPPATALAQYAAICASKHQRQSGQYAAAGWEQQAASSSSRAVSPLRCSWYLRRSAVFAAACLVHVRRHRTRRSRRTYGCRGEKALAAVANAALVIEPLLQRSFWTHGAAVRRESWDHD